MPRVRLKVGDILEVPLAEGKVGYVQDVADDASMLDSYVIGVFAGEHDPTKPPEVSDIASGNMTFFAHVFQKLCIKIWKLEESGQCSGPRPD